MLQLEGKTALRQCDGMTRRDFLRVGALGAGAVGLTLADPGLASAVLRREVNCILLFLVGGPSQIDTWDPKPDAPDQVRGPFGTITTAVPGIRLAETFPRMARAADRFALVRTVHHDAAPIHETGHQLLQTGRLARGGVEFPHYGSVVSALRGRRCADAPASVIVPAPIGDTGVSAGHGQGASFLGPPHESLVVRGEPGSPSLAAAVDTARRAFDAAQEGFGGGAQAYAPVFSGAARRAFDVGAEPVGLLDRYGRNTFGQSCLLARRLVEAGVRLVTVNMFDTVFGNVTWDCHADGGSLATTLNDYRRTLCPVFDRAYTALLDDLDQRGMLGTTLVLAAGEFGRTPELNPRGGRDHWPGCWTVLFAGAGIGGGRVVGASDARAAEPRERPVSPAELAATVYRALGIDPQRTLPGSDGSPVPLADSAPIEELFQG
jgi:uncharacterized protein (DUF1501 family)